MPIRDFFFYYFNEITRQILLNQVNAARVAGRPTGLTIMRSNSNGLIATSQRPDSKVYVVGHLPVFIRPWLRRTTRAVYRAIS